MTSKFFCSKCSQLVTNKEDLFNHVFLHHRDLIKPAEIGLPNSDKLKNQILQFIGDTPAGQKLLTAFSSFHVRLTTQIAGMSLGFVELFNRDQPARTARFDFRQLEDFDTVADQIVHRERLL